VQIRVVTPFPFEALPRVWRWIEPFREKVSDDFSPRDLTAFLDCMQAQWGRLRTWAVHGGGELGGLVTFERMSPWLGSVRYLLKPDFQGHGFTLKASRLAVAEMFAEPGLGKLEFQVLAAPYCATSSLVCALGARREGTLIGHTMSGGHPRDVWLYGLSKEGFEAGLSTRHADGRSIPGGTARGADPDAKCI
jgi:RimJ/RimL family protein N-acetyltransferase